MIKLEKKVAEFIAYVLDDCADLMYQASLDAEIDIPYSQPILDLLISFIDENEESGYDWDNQYIKDVYNCGLLKNLAKLLRNLPDD